MITALAAVGPVSQQGALSSMVVRCSQCNGLLRVDEDNLPVDRRAKIRCPHCKGIGLMPERTDGNPSSAEPNSAPDADYPVLVPAKEPPRPRDWKEAAMPQDAFKSFRYPEERSGRTPGKKPPAKRWSLILWVVVSVAVVAFFAVLVNKICRYCD